MERYVCLIISFIFLLACDSRPPEVKKLRGVYQGDITYYETGKQPFVVKNQNVHVDIFSDDIPTSSDYRVLLKTEPFAIPGVYIEFKSDSILSFAALETIHNISINEHDVTLSEGICVADLGFPIGFPIHITGTIKDTQLQLDIVIDASFGNNKKIHFEGVK